MYLWSYKCRSDFRVLRTPACANQTFYFTQNFSAVQSFQHLKVKVPFMDPRIGTSFTSFKHFAGTRLIGFKHVTLMCRQNFWNVINGSTIYDIEVVSTLHRFYTCGFLYAPNLMSEIKCKFSFLITFLEIPLKILLQLCVRMNSHVQKGP